MTGIARRPLIGAGGVIGAVAYAAAARAQGGWRPSQAVRIVVPAAPGGTTDIMGRLLAAHLQQRWGQNAVAENKSGGGGTIGTTEVVRARPDGHTILLGNIGPQAIAYSLFRNLQYSPEDLAPVSTMLGNQPNVLVVHPSLPVNSVPEFVRHIRQSVVRHGEIEAEQGEDGADQPFGLSRRQAEHGTERHAVVMARAEYRGCPPRPVRGSARHASTASGVNHTVRLPRARRPAS